jgi:hypothetical protein
MADSATGCYHRTMPKKPLIETNAYLRDPMLYRKALVTNVSSSTAIETGTKIEAIARALTKEGKAEMLPVRTRQGSGR